MTDAVAEPGLVKIKPEELVIEKIGGPADLIAWSKGLVLQSQDDYDLAGQVFLKIKAREKHIDERCRPNIERWHDGHKAACAELKHELAPFVESRTLIGPKLADWDAKIEAERKRLELEEQARRRKEAEDQQIAEAAEAEAAGQTQLAEEIISAPPVAVAPVNLPKAAQPQGLSFRTYWSGEVVNLRALVNAVADGKVPINAIEANMKVINGQAELLKENFNWPGCRAKSERKPAGRVK